MLKLFLIKKKKVYAREEILRAFAHMRKQAFISVSLVFLKEDKS